MSQKLVTVFVFCCVIKSVLCQSLRTYIYRYEGIASKLETQYDVPKNLILAVSAHESNNGVSRLAREWHNYFGMASPSKLRRHIVPQAKEYTTYEDSFKDFCEYLSHREFYTTLKGNMDCGVWIAAISKAGYCVTPLTWKIQVMQTLRRITMVQAAK